MKKAVTMLLLINLFGTAHAEIIITQEQALNGDVTPGDLPGFPITISQPGSYRLESNLLIEDEDISGIDIRSDYVTINLDGHSVIGPQICAGTSQADCYKYGYSTGITSRQSGTYNYISVFNGNISGMHRGVYLGTNSKVENLLITRNRYVGLSISTYSLVKNNRVNFNGGSGISVGSYSSIIDNVADSNGSSGISVGYGSTVTQNTAGNNASDGIRTTFRGNVINNIAINNDRTGIHVGPYARVTDNSITDNETGLRISTGGTFGNNFISNNTDTNLLNYGASQLSPNKCGGQSC